MDIIKNKKYFFGLSIIIILAGLVAMLINVANGESILNYDIEFTGGVSIDISIGKEFENEDIVAIVQKHTDDKSPMVQKIMGTNDVTIKMQPVTNEVRAEIVTDILQKYDLDESAVLKISDISGTVSFEMQRKALVAILLSSVLMLIYITIRFKDFKAGASAILALIHDLLIVLAFYAMLRIPVNNAFIAAALTVLGYSINATIVIFDRIRENKKGYRPDNYGELVNKSVNQTLRRSINTSVTTILAIGSIYVLGVRSVKELALPLIIGMTSGIYSSVFLSGAMWHSMHPKK
ncbi:MAG: protein translocase subunit SecF [Lachnospiraceae bacterium]|nr:protein translocase subunit SecF [Lachnospiraceae bacterium]